MVLKDPSTPAQVRCQSCYDYSNWQRLKWYKGQGSSAQAVTGFVQGWMGQRDVHLHWPMIKLQQSQTHRLCCDNKNINRLHKIPVNKPVNCYTVIAWEFDYLISTANFPGAPYVDNAKRQSMRNDHYYYCYIINHAFQQTKIYLQEWNVLVFHSSLSQKIEL